MERRMLHEMESGILWPFIGIWISARNYENRALGCIPLHLYEGCKRGTLVIIRASTLVQ